MKISKENIEEVNTILIKNNVHYIDLRIEIIDHLCSELETMEGRFETVFPDFFESKKQIVQQMLRSHIKTGTRKGIKMLVQKLMSRRFLVFFLILNCIILLGNQYFDKNWILQNFDIWPIIISSPISFVLLYNVLLSKNKSTDLIELLAITNIILISYLFGIIYFIRNTDSFIWIPLFSFFITLSIAYYFFYFESKRLHQMKYTSLWS